MLTMTEALEGGAKGIYVPLILWVDHSGHYMLLLTHEFYLYLYRRVFYFFWMARLLFGVDTPEGPPTAQTPLPVPPPDRKGYHSAPF